jgi:hypothetical protein
MKKLLTNIEGGFPLHSDDLTFFDEAVRESFFGLFSAFGIENDENFKLSGVVTTYDPNTAKMHTTEGWVVINGEVLRVLEHESDVDPFALPPYYIQPIFQLHLVETTSRAFYNAEQHNVHQMRYAQMVKFSEINEDLPFMIANAKYIHEIIREKILALGEEPWKEIGSIGNAVFLNGVSNKNGLSTAAYRVLSNGMIVIKGCLELDSTVELFVLPAGYRPSQIRLLSAVGTTGTNPLVVEPNHVKINTNGLVELEYACDFISLDGLCFLPYSIFT